MGKYTNVNVERLQDTVKTALRELTTYSNYIRNVTNDLNNSRNLQTKAKTVLNTSLTNVNNSSSLNGSNPVLKEKLQTLEKAGSLIKKWQQLEKEIASLEERKYKTEYNKATKRSEKVLDNRVVNQISSKKSTLKTYENQIDNLLV